MGYGKRLAAGLLCMIFAGSYAGNVMAENNVEKEITNGTGTVWITDNENLMQIVEGSNQLGNRISARLIAQEIEASEDYVFISPYSIATALSILSECSEEGKQVEELKEMLGFGEMTDEEIRESQALLLENVKKGFYGKAITEEQRGMGEYCTVELANALYLDDEATAVPAFAELPEQLAVYDAEVDMKPLETEETLEEINEWAAEKTHGLIERILEEPMDEETMLFIMNSVYFNGFWSFPFDESATEYGPFTSPFRKTKIAVQVPMMQLEEFLTYAETEEYQIVTLPYRAEYYMTVYLPKDMYECRKWTDETYLEELTGTSYEFKNRKVSLAMPRFELEYQAELEEILGELGMTEIFEPAVYDRLCEETLVVDRIIHKTALNVDENGTEASAVTALMLDNGALIDENPVEMSVDHPFYFTITHRRTGLKLFEGCVMDLSEAE